ncbi:alpha/beta hydrolase [Nocardia sp. NPDC058058]|uniref:alpha/beta hydrolase n=1 Tax=Nocardia sp. NPDC058058 TaxID=3346317 RepID=UPI0036DABF24
MPYFEGGRGRLHYRRWPITDPTARIALLPGTGQHSGHYHRFAGALKPAGIELWTLDTSGHGLSEGDIDRPGTLPELSADARAFLDQAPADSVPLFLMGHSLGAATAVAALCPAASATPALAGLILCGTPRAVLEGRPPKSARGADPSSARGNAVTASRTADSMRFAVTDSSGGIGRDRSPAPDEIAATTDAGSRSRATMGPVVPEGLPVLFVHGVDDRRTPIEPVRAWATTVAAEFREYADAGHDLLHEPVHAEVSADIANWVGRIAAC